MGALLVCSVETLPTLCWTVFLEHRVLGPAALPVERAAGPANPTGRAWLTGGRETS